MTSAMWSSPLTTCSASVAACSWHRLHQNDGCVPPQVRNVIARHDAFLELIDHPRCETYRRLIVANSLDEYFLKYRKSLLVDHTICRDPSIPGFCITQHPALSSRRNRSRHPDSDFASRLSSALSTWCRERWCWIWRGGRIHASAQLASRSGSAAQRDGARDLGGRHSPVF
eukprot:SAG31_NODE_2309_length_5961_cov_3.697373_7_plen_171_part_00